MAVRIQFEADGTRTVTQLESAHRVGTPQTRTEQVRLDFREQYAATVREIRAFEAKIEALYGHDPRTGRRGYRVLTEDGRLRSKAEQEHFEREAAQLEAMYRRRIEGLRERLESITEIGNMRLAEAAAIDSADAQRQAELVQRAEQKAATSAENDLRRSVGLPLLKIGD
ncbi:MAG TPA: hypothetical protein VF161_00880 [Steroidobacteraceae bacterium]